MLMVQRQHQHLITRHQVCRKTMLNDACLEGNVEKLKVHRCCKFLAI